MPRPKSEHPTQAELEVLQILWDRGPLTVRKVWEVLNQRRRRHYTTAASLLNTMTGKGLLTCEPEGRAFLYRPNVAREKTLGEMVEDLVDRAFEGSASALVLHALDQCDPSPEEMDEIARILRQYRKQKGNK